MWQNAQEWYSVHVLGIRIGSVWLFESEDLIWDGLGLGLV